MTKDRHPKVHDNQIVSCIKVVQLLHFWTEFRIDIANSPAKSNDNYVFCFGINISMRMVAKQIERPAIVEEKGAIHRFIII